MGFTALKGGLIAAGTIGLGAGIGIATAGSQRDRNIATADIVKDAVTIGLVAGACTFMVSGYAGRVAGDLLGVSYKSDATVWAGAAGVLTGVAAIGTGVATHELTQRGSIF